MSRGRARLRRTFVGVGMAAVAVVGVGGPAPSGAQEAPETPVVSILDGYGPEAYTYICDGETTTWAFLDGATLLVLDRQAVVDVPVAIGYEGSLVDRLVDPVPEVVFAPGDDAMVVPFVVDEVVDGDLTVTIEPGEGYEVGVDASITFDVSAEPIELGDCNEDLGDPPGGTDRQTIAVGEKPVPIGFFPDSEDATVAEDVAGAGLVPEAVADRARFTSRIDDLEPGYGFTTPVIGELPPGLAYAEDVWSGAATTPGTYDFDVRLCLPDVPITSPDDVPEDELVIDICLGEVDVRIVVEEATTTSPPATPVRAPARFTG